MSNAYDQHGDPGTRAGDADREQVAEVLRTHHTEGRLDTDEMQERIDACYQAKTVGDLEALLDDLPRGQAAELARHGHGDHFLAFGRPRMLRLWPILIALIALSIVTGHHFFLWIAIPLFFVAMRLLAPWHGRRRRARAGGHWA